MTGRNTASRATDPATQDARSRAALMIVFAITLTVLALRLTDLDLPPGISHDARTLEDDRYRLPAGSGIRRR